VRKRPKIVAFFARSKWRGLHLGFPGGSDATEHDAGRAVALWVSAFEIVAHNGRHADFQRVLSLLSRVQWLSPKLKAQDRVVRKGLQTNLAGVIYDRLNTARNHFLHGNPVSAETLTLEKCQKHAHLFAPSLFRMALTAFLDLRFSEEVPTDAQGLGRHIAARMEFTQAQRISEDAILLADESTA
jgi:hypothetical protein